ncbi:MAG TPA: hypothetical protein VG122_17870 [Gemmata sp.]|nr:hypothetical protein [Gemmata sp.]
MARHLRVVLGCTQVVLGYSRFAQDCFRVVLGILLAASWVWKAAVSVPVVGPVEPVDHLLEVRNLACPHHQFEWLYWEGNLYPQQLRSDPTTNYRLGKVAICPPRRGMLVDRDERTAKWVHTRSRDSQRVRTH